MTPPARRWFAVIRSAQISADLSAMSFFCHLVRPGFLPNFPNGVVRREGMIFLPNWLQLDVLPGTFPTNARIKKQKEVLAREVHCQTAKPHSSSMFCKSKQGTAKMGCGIHFESLHSHRRPQHQACILPRQHPSSLEGGCFIQAQCPRDRDRSNGHTSGTSQSDL